MSRLQPIRFGVDGWVDRMEEGRFCEDNLRRVAEALGMLWSDSNPFAYIYIGYDSRFHAREHARLFAGVLRACGLKVKLSDSVCPLPALSLACLNDIAACGAVMIGADNLGEEYQGVKIRMADGTCAPEKFIAELEGLLPPEPSVAPQEVGECDLLGPYYAHLATLVDTEAIREAGLSVVVDPLYGAAQGNFASFLEGLGVKVREIHGTGYGDFHGLRPDPVEPWVSACSKAVVQAGADMGLVLDGDADRSGLVDAEGTFIGPHCQAGLVLAHLHDKGMHGRVVRTVTCSRYVRRTSEVCDFPGTVVPMGFKWVGSEIEKGDVLLGAEELGGLALPHHLPERDGIYVALLMVEMLALRGRSLREMVERLEEHVGHFEYARRNLKVDPGDLETFRILLPGLNPQELAGAVPTEIGHRDGLSLSFDDDSWILLRPSRMEPIVRAYAEAHNILRRDELMEAALDFARSEVGLHS